MRLLAGSSANALTLPSTKSFDQLRRITGAPDIPPDGKRCQRGSTPPSSDKVRLGRYRCPTSITGKPGGSIPNG